MWMGDEGYPEFVESFAVGYGSKWQTSGVTGDSGSGSVVYAARKVRTGYEIAVGITIATRPDLRWHLPNVPQDGVMILTRKTIKAPTLRKAMESASAAGSLYLDMLTVWANARYRLLSVGPVAWEPYAKHDCDWCYGHPQHTSPSIP